MSVEERKNITPEKALEILLKGNERFIQNSHEEKNHKETLKYFLNMQKPFAFVLGCIDSRAPSEIIFDQGLGDLLTARVAGNVLNEDLIASAEFAVDVIEVKIIMILGHTKCGAMKACINNYKKGYLSHLVSKIEPIYKKNLEIISNSHSQEDELAKFNVLEVMDELLQKSEIIYQKLKEKKILLVGAMFHLDSGKVEIINKKEI